ncbi:ABC transporter permease subunit [Endozoicomonas sp. Mp262]|uniref:ABC transporter permease subunit n=1 Tax=Endozoicomonas sp. Mp262 TaxID=2919499 RepID=UPI0021D9DF94
MHHRPMEKSPGVDFYTPALKRYQTLRFIKEKLAHWGVATGGLGVILAIALIFFYLLYEVAPLFKGAKLNLESSYSRQITENSTVLFLAMDEYAEIALRILSSGQAIFSSAKSGQLIKQLPLPIPEGVKVTAIARASANSNLLVIGLSNGQVILVKQHYSISWPDNQRVITPLTSYPYGKQPIHLFSQAHAIKGVAISDSDERLLIAGSSDNKLAMTAFSKKEDFLTGETRLEQQAVVLPVIKGAKGKVLISEDQSWLYTMTEKNQLAIINVSNPDKPRFHSRVNLTEGSENITAIESLLGGVSLLTGDSSGQISQWFLVRQGESSELKLIRRFKLADNPITQLIPEQRQKGFLATDTRGQVGLFYTTAHRVLLTQQLSDTPINQLAISPRGHALIVDSDSTQQYYQLENEHPELSWSALWDKIWYESYDQPEFIWQSSASNNDFEPKLSLTPLAFGTLKAAFYAMLLATPLAICGAIYTAYFMAPALRRKVKPAIELMEALPTVILGFLAGLWLAPFIENHLLGIFSLLLLVPVGILLFALVWESLPGNIRHRVPDGWHAILLIPVVLASGALAFALAVPIEQWLFHGDIRTWLTTELGIPYDQRNALVVGLAMGFAVIPTIFSIAEDAIFSVPRHLTYGSLALGATPWQTLSRVVLLTASPGIFSAVMIGMGRAVGETMIVLMATGNTPIMDANIFEGMRTLAANIAVEMPESEVGSSHYRILFLAALVLFLFTFVVNTAAEIIRHRLRKRYSSL